MSKIKVFPINKTHDHTINYDFGAQPLNSAELFSRCNECVCSPVMCDTPYLSSYLTAWSMEQCLMILWDGIPFTHTTRINGNQQKINRKKS